MPLKLKEGECGALVIDWNARDIKFHGLDGNGEPATPEAMLAIFHAHKDKPDVKVLLLVVFDFDGDRQLTYDSTREDFIGERCEEVDPAVDALEMLEELTSILRMHAGVLTQAERDHVDTIEDRVIAMRADIDDGD